jgi:hypothetical protein
MSAKSCSCDKPSSALLCSLILQSSTSPTSSTGAFGKGLSVGCRCSPPLVEVLWDNGGSEYAGVEWLEEAFVLFENEV